MFTKKDFTLYELVFSFAVVTLIEYIILVSETLKFSLLTSCLLACLINILAV